MFATYDIVMLVVLAGAIAFGFWKGLAWQVASLAAVFASYFVAVSFRGVLTPMISVNPPLNGFIAMLILYVGTSLVIWLAFGAVRRNIERMQLKEFDRQSGALLGALKGALLCMVITMFAVTVAGENSRRAVIQSKSGNLIARSINQLSAVVPADLHKVLDPYFSKFNERLTEPLPPETAPGNWTFGQAAAATSPPASTPFTGQFQLPVQVQAQPGGGFQVNINPNATVDRAAELLRNSVQQNLPAQQGGQGVNR